MIFYILKEDNKKYFNEQVNAEKNDKTIEKIDDKNEMSIVVSQSTTIDKKDSTENKKVDTKKN